ncbi:actin-like protein Arp4 [Schizosaccharomyces octosporus yFS286]|uniref:Actin-related protein 4 n=1 Tax=Schizosaccharomyces octosporus (strain yFS286) TaxID=483514 RepID=S9Q4C1_SCHOY|nr:actin-like protein Arp4 [Schizosaccharomyces octosporus yFS286]EPX74503.1 actin-like protein Arp4 [Schizosaccharomyces octosporus yFS286]
MSGNAFYGGDEVSAIVIDPGSKWTRIGFSGEDIPKCVLPSNYGEFEDGRRLFGEEYIYQPHKGMEIKRCVSNGWIQQWDATLDLWQYALKERLKTDPSEHPILVTEPFDNPSENRVKTMEMVFESLGSPATYLARQEACAAFASGKGTACLIDVGYDRASVSAIHDGFVLQKPYNVQQFAGAALDEIIADTLRRKGYETVPKYLVRSKHPVGVGESPKYERANINTTESFHRFQLERVYDEWKEECALTADVPFDSDHTILDSEFEFPDGARVVFGADRYQIPERLFKPSEDTTMNEQNDENENEKDGDGDGDDEEKKNTSNPKTKGICQLFQNCISECDVDIRNALFNNIVVCGGTSLLQGFSIRLQNDLSKIYPGNRLKIHASGHIIERSYASWLGGSILSSLGTFHQLWISRQEYDEHGADRLALIEKRCK